VIEMMTGYMIAVAMVATIGEPERFFGVSDAASMVYAQRTDTGKALIRNLGSEAILAYPGATYWLDDNFKFQDGITEFQMLRSLGFSFFEFRFGCSAAPRSSRIAPDFSYDQILPGDNPLWEDGVDPDIYDTLAFLAMQEVLHLTPEDRANPWIGNVSVWPVRPEEWRKMMSAALGGFFPYVDFGDSAIVTVENEPDHFRWRMQEIYFLVYWDNGRDLRKDPLRRHHLIQRQALGQDNQKGGMGF